VLCRAQVQRLVTVLGTRGVRRGALLEDAVLERAAGGLNPSDAATLAAAGWTPGTGLRTLLNFSGALEITLPHQEPRVHAEAPPPDAATPAAVCIGLRTPKVLEVPAGTL